MAPQRVYVDRQDEGVLRCSACGKRKRLVGFSRVARFDDVVKVKCSCGYVFEVVLERRNFFRMLKVFHGRYVGPGEGQEGEIVIEDVSVGGVGFRTLTAHALQPEDELLLEYSPRRNQSALVRERVVVKRIEGDYIGARVVESRTATGLLDPLPSDALPTEPTVGSLVTPPPASMRPPSSEGSRES